MGAGSRRASRAAGGGTLLLALLSLSCFEPPIRETLELRFLPGNAAMVVVRVKLAKPGMFKQSAAARERIESAQRDLAAGEDEWSRRFRRLEPAGERLIQDRGPDGLEQVLRQAIVESAEALPEFFTDTLIQAGFEARETESQITLAPGPGGRASRAQRDAYGRSMDRWQSSMAGYLRSGLELYEYLDRNPHRARACFARIFQDILPEEERGEVRELEPAEKSMVDPFIRSMNEALGLFDVPEDSAYSLEELSRLVHDPFPAPLTVRVPGPILSFEGFAESGPGVLVVPGLSLGSALQAEEERWIRPNPMALVYRHLGRRENRFSLDDFLGRPRSAVAAGEREILVTLQRHLSPAPVYRVRWSTEGLPGLEDLPDSTDVWSLPGLAVSP